MTPKAAGFAFFLLFFPGVATTAQAPPGEPAFSEAVEVELAEVDVFVTDRDGQPVPGLTREDFQVTEDGQPVEITNLSSIDLPLVLAVFFDETNLDGPSRAAVVKSLRSLFADHLRPGDRVLLTSAEGSLKLLQEPTGDPAALTAALDALAAGAPKSAARTQERNGLLREILQGEKLDDERPALGLGPSHASATYAAIRVYIQQRSAEAHATLASLGQLVDSLAGLPGRKALLYAGGGLPLRPGQDLVDAWMIKYSLMARQVGASPLDTQRWDATPIVKEIVDRANAGRITLYALAMPEGGSRTSAEGEGSADGRRTRAGTDRDDAARALRTLAGGTGGLVAVDVPNPVSLVEPMRRDLGAVYSLGFAPPPGRKPGRHSLEVKPRNPSFTVRHRGERFDLPPGDPLARLALSTLLLGGGENPLHATLQFEEDTREADGRFRVTAVVTLPLTALLLLPQEHFHAGSLTVSIAVSDGARKVSGIPRAEVPIQIPNEHLLAAPGQVAGYRFTLLLAPGEATIVAAVRDETSGASAVIRSVHTPAVPR